MWPDIANVQDNETSHSKLGSLLKKICFAIQNLQYKLYYKSSGYNIWYRSTGNYFFHKDGSQIRFPNICCETRDYTLYLWCRDNVSMWIFSSFCWMRMDVLENRKVGILRISCQNILITYSYIKYCCFMLFGQTNDGKVDIREIGGISK